MEQPFRYQLGYAEPFGRCMFVKGLLKEINEIRFIVETPIPKANNLKVTIGAAELVSCNETQTLKAKRIKVC